MESFATPNFAASAKPSTSIANNEVYQKAQELEGVFLNTLMSQMFSSLETDSLFGGGHAEETWRSMQSEQYADLLSQNGGVGLADQIMANLLVIQENANATSTKANSTNIYQPIKEAQ